MCKTLWNHHGRAWKISFLRHSENKLINPTIYGIFPSLLWPQKLILQGQAYLNNNTQNVRKISLKSTEMKYEWRIIRKSSQHSRVRRNFIDLLYQVHKKNIFLKWMWVRNGSFQRVDVLIFSVLSILQSRPSYPSLCGLLMCPGWVTDVAEILIPSVATSLGDTQSPGALGPVTSGC